jgi:uncharacterized protein
MRDSSGWIGTHSGTKFWPLEPRSMEICIEDIAHSLARQCRFNGHCGPFYSVAEHSIEVSYQVPPQFALWGLLHDAAETYLSDIVRPLKGHCVYSVRRRGIMTGQTYRETERDLLFLMARRFGLSPALPPPEVETADDRMLATERQQLFDARQPHWDGLDGIDPYPIVLRCMECVLAEELFLHRFKELTANG